MDLSTITGLLLGAGCVAVALVIGGSFGAYVDPVALLIVVGGAGAATLTSVPLRRFFRVHKVSLKTLLHRCITPQEQIARLVSLSEVARREGVLALEGTLEEIDDPFLVRGVQLAIDGADAETIRMVLETELDVLVERHEAGRSMFEQLGRYAPAFGMIGTVIGLVAMLANMDDPSAIGAGMAAALLTTLYGALLANLVFLPLADKLAARTTEEVRVRSMAIQGVLGIQAGDNPRHVESKLRTFLPPRSRVEGVLRQAA
ncbi:MAG: motility protein A [Phycisphaerales bacterium]|nr:motility protein A [Phycisphaerales bacterium]